MMSLWISDYLPNTLGYAIYRHNLLNYTLTCHDLPDKLESCLNTTCSTEACCLRNVFPGLSSSYPNTSVQVEMALSKAPITNISNNQIQVTLSGVVIYRTRLNGSDVDVLKVNVELVVCIVITLNAAVLKFNVTHLIPSAVVVSSSVGSISSEKLSQALETFSNSLLIQKLNKKGQKGVSFPVLSGIKFNNIDLEMRNHCLYIATDVQRS